MHSSDFDSDGTDTIPYRQNCVAEELAWCYAGDFSADSDPDEGFGNAAPDSLIVDFGSSCCEEHPHGAHRIRQFYRTVHCGRQVKDIVVASAACLEVVVDKERLPVECCCYEVQFQPTTVPVGVVDWLESLEGEVAG